MFREEILHLHEVSKGNFDDLPEKIPREKAVSRLYHFTLETMLAGAWWLVFERHSVHYRISDKTTVETTVGNSIGIGVDLLAHCARYDPLFRARIDPFALEFVRCSQLRLPVDFVYWVPIMDPPRWLTRKQLADAGAEIARREPTVGSDAAYLAMQRDVIARLLDEHEPKP